MEDIERTIYTFIHGACVGALHRVNYTDGTQKYVFEYEDKVRPEDAVSLTMPVAQKRYEFDYLPAFFRMNNPEGHNLQYLTKENFFADDKDPLTILKVMGPYMIGRVQYSSEKEFVPHDLLEVDKNYVKKYGRRAFNEYQEGIKKSGISGVMPKIMTELKNQLSGTAAPEAPAQKAEGAPLINVTRTLVTKDVILKTFNKDNNWDRDAENEYFCLKAAQCAGLPTPEFTLSDDGEVLIIGRFDKNGDHHLGFEESWSVLNMRGRLKKYLSSYEQLANTIQATVDVRRVPDALRDFFKSLVLNTFVRNADAHPKNYGFLYEREDVVYTCPYYDINTVYTNPEYIKEPMALPLYHELRGTHVNEPYNYHARRWRSKDDLIEFAVKHCLLRRGEAEKEYEAVKVAVETAIQSMQEYMQSQPAFNFIGARMISIWQQAMDQPERPAIEIHVLTDAEVVRLRQQKGQEQAAAERLPASTEDTHVFFDFEA